MSKSKIVGLLLLAAFCACKSTSTNPLDGQKLRIITSDLDTTSVVPGPVTFTVSVLSPSGYGAQGAYINFYDPIQHRSRHEGPAPEAGTLEITDTVPASLGGGVFEFAFVAEDGGAINSDSLKLWIKAKDIRAWIIDSIEANSGYGQNIGVKWSRPAADSSTDTIFVTAEGSVFANTFLAPYPQNTTVISAFGNGTDTIAVHNAFATSQSIVWAPADYYLDINLYSNVDPSFYSGLYFSGGEAVPMSPSEGWRSLVDLVLASDPNNSASGLTIVSPSVSSLSGFSGGRITALYHPIQFIDSGINLRELYYTNDLSTYVTGSTPVNEIPLPDSNQYSTAFIAVTADGHFAQVCVSPITHDWQNNLFVNVALSYQTVSGLPYAGRGRRHR